MTSPLGSESITDVITALISAKKDFDPVVKDRTNPAFKTKYADLGAVLDAVEPSLLKNDLVLLQPTGVDGDGRFISYTFLVHKSGQYLTSEYPLKPTKEDPQGYGSALTYARRYQLLSLLGLSPEDDDGAAASAKPRQETPPRDFLKELADCTTEEQVIELGKAAASVGEWDKLKDQFIARRTAVKQPPAEPTP